MQEIDTQKNAEVVSLGREVMLAHEIFDRSLIEQHAATLIERHLQVARHEMYTLPGESHHNAETALFEKITAAGDVSTIDFTGDQHYIHNATMRRLLNAYSCYLPYWEQERRFNEICEELIVHSVWQRVAFGELPGDTVVATISNFPDNAPSDREAVDNGYRALNQKGMVRTYEFFKNSDGEWVRRLDQVSRSNSNDGTAERWFSQNGLIVKGSTKVLSAQAVSSKRRLNDGAISLTKELDSLAGQPVLYGELLSEAKRLGRPAYDIAREVSRERRQQLTEMTNELAMLDSELQKQVESGSISYARKLQLYEVRQQRLIDEICILSPQYAEDTKGKSAAKFYHLAAVDLHNNNLESFKINLEKGKKLTDKNASVACGGNGNQNEKSFKKDEGPEQPDSYAEEVFEGASKKKEKWKYVRGVCAVKSCPTRPGETLVGPCSVCENCTKLDDIGIKLDSFSRMIFSMYRNSPVESKSSSKVTRNKETNMKISA